jgi:hypothetical protein
MTNEGSNLQNTPSDIGTNTNNQNQTPTTTENIEDSHEQNPETENKSKNMRNRDEKRTPFAQHKPITYAGENEDVGGSGTQK